MLDDKRLKNPDGRPDYFYELLAHIRDIRASEKKIYQNSASDFPRQNITTKHIQQLNTSLPKRKIS
ncbi:MULTISPECIES: RhuM family protein [Megasphaera]|uniref:Virulence RhuM family protein n=1 Tax=Megasphaera massiliensis TaxID=1232428 RepID=A0ABT1SSP2_9FIRM|nr:MULTISPECIES: RhuM family protein [Megasphaera]MCQ5262968.1 virulence RhuM family protein [Megasphaera massiliensis]MCQ5313571.1 virulence RhuM family protein [Megasphaera massiliensis]MCQ5322901.1 virulence RhuM family protein [Megasphaera massiliensis]MCQ5332667.1 virulence RhuM family protein [Megasphaera massiliensis]MCQ5342896.1 virulence RhuM family protein [Megasphaera massiliensis]